MSDSLDKSKTYFNQNQNQEQGLNKLSVITESNNSIIQNDDSLINY
jgi:hypothetical protein